MSIHEELINAAEAAISDLFGDQSVTQRDTVVALQDLIGYIETLSNAIEADIMRDEEIIISDEELS